MSYIKFELKEEHVILMGQLDWTNPDNLPNSWADFQDNFDHIEEGLASESPFGGDDIYQDMGLILYGIPEGDFDPTGEEQPAYTDEQMEEMKKLFSELPIAIDVVMNMSSFNLGHYKTKHYDRNWKEYTPKK